MTFPLSQVSQEAENLSLDSLSLEDAHFRITLPAEIEYYRWGNREDELKEQEQRFGSGSGANQKAVVLVRAKIQPSPTLT